MNRPDVLRGRHVYDVAPLPGLTLPLAPLTVGAISHSASEEYVYPRTAALGQVQPDSLTRRPKSIKGDAPGHEEHHRVIQ